MRNILILATILIPSLCLAVAENKLVDVGIFTKKDGKAILLVFDKEADKKSWKIKFNGKILNIILSGFATDIKKENLDFSSIPGIEDVNISSQNSTITLSLKLKQEIRTLINSGKLTFLTKNPYTLGIMFTNPYLNDVQDKEEIEIPFINYEDILSSVKDIKPSDTKPLKKNNAAEVKKKKTKPKQLPPKREAVHLKKENNVDLFKITASLSAVIGIVIITLFLWKKLLFFKYRNNQQLIKILEIHHFGSKQYIAVLKIEDEGFLIGITPENITLLTRLSIKESRDSIPPEHNLADEDTISQKAVNIIKERFGQLKRI